MTILVPDPPSDVASRESRTRRTWRRFRPQRLPMFALFVLLAVILCSVVLPLLLSQDPNEITGTPLDGPSSEYWFGTDDIGRDLFIRTLLATRFSLGVSLIAVGLALGIGLLFGLVSGYFGGRVDLVLMRIVDAIMSFPGLLMAMAVVGILGPGVRNAMIGLAVAFSPTFARLIRGEVLAVREEGYVEAARVAGLGNVTIIRRHILPNIVPPVLIQTFLMMGIALIAEGALSFLGLSVQPPEASLGSLLQRGFTLINFTSRLILVPGLVITVIAWTFNTIADGLGDALGRKDLGE